MKKRTHEIPAPTSVIVPETVSPAPQRDETAAKLKEAQTARRAAEQRADEIAKQLSAATLEIMRLKAEVYDLQHGLA